ncbi:MAG: putative toxin-antitoxin system toxin component, PIN family [Bacillota bacterium]
MKIILDTNTIMLGMAFTGNERELLDAIYRYNETLILSEYLVSETKAILKQKFLGAEKLFDDFLTYLQYEIAPLPSAEKVKEAKDIIRDPKDAVVLATVLEVKPDIFVSGDLDFHASDITFLTNVMHSKEAIAMIEYQTKQ